MKTIIFDFDGVIAKNSQFLEDFLIKVLPFLDRKKAKQLIINTALNNKQPSYISRLIRKYGSHLYLNFLKERSIQKDFWEKLEIQHDIIECVKSLKSNSFLLTSNYSPICKFILKDDFSVFKQTISFSEVKSKSEGIKQWIDSRDIDLDETIFITDTSGDIKEFQKFTDKKNIIGVTWGFHDKSKFVGLVDDKNLFNNTSDLITYLNSFDN